MSNCTSRSHWVGPWHSSPSQPAKNEPDVGFATSVTGVPCRKYQSHVGGQLTPAGVLEIVQVPSPASFTETRKACAAVDADESRAAAPPPQSEVSTNATGMTRRRARIESARPRVYSRSVCYQTQAAPEAWLPVGAACTESEDVSTSPGLYHANCCHTTHVPDPVGWVAPT